MGWRWRKYIGLPAGTRAIISKGGIGFSWGFLGLRVGRSPTGNLWISFSIPGTGISFMKYLPSFLSKSANVMYPLDSSTGSSARKKFPVSSIQSTTPLTSNQRVLEKIKQM